MRISWINGIKLLLNINYLYFYICRCYRNAGPCTFEIDQCSYTNDPTGLFPWILQGGSATPPPSLPLPSYDHTTGSGYYMVVDYTAQSQSSDYARLQGPLIQEMSARCSMTFYYVLSGQSKFHGLNTFIYLPSLIEIRQC